MLTPIALRGILSLMIEIGSITNIRKGKRMKKIVNELNRIIERENLYRDNSRFIHARAVKGTVFVENLYTGELIKYVNDGSFRNGYSRTVKL